MNDVKITVIVPCYNCEKTVVETLDALNGSAELIYEVICVNDGSTDSTLDILNRYTKETALNIKIVDSENCGVSVARNKGIEAAGGDVLLFLDADDKYSPLFFQKILSHYKEYDTVYGYFTRDESTLEIDVDGECAVSKDMISVQTEFMVNKERCHTAAFSYKKQIIDEWHLRFTPGARYGEDWEFTTKYLSLCRNAMCLNRRIFFYRDSDVSVIKSPTYAHAHAIEAAVRTEEFLNKNESAFYPEFSIYMRHRAVFSVAHNFSKFKRKDLFDKLTKEYPVRQAMSAMLKSKHNGIKVKLASLSCLLSKNLFFYVVGRM